MPANVDQRSANGSTPLFIAVHMRDYDICRVLLAANADPTIKNRKDKTPLDLARENRDSALAAEQKRAEAESRDPQRRRFRRKGVDPSIRIAAMLESETQVNESLDELRAELAPYLVPHVIESGVPIGDDEEDEPDSESEEVAEVEIPAKIQKTQKPAKKKRKFKAEPREPSSEMLRILEILKSLDQRVQRMEAGYYARSPSRDVSTDRQAPAVCAHCGFGMAEQCPTCKLSFCRRCIAKESVHKCTA
jgi:hypothetical protein